MPYHEAMSHRSCGSACSRCGCSANVRMTRTRWQALAMCKRRENRQEGNIRASTLGTSTSSRIEVVPHTWKTGCAMRQNLHPSRRMQSHSHSVFASNCIDQRSPLLDIRRSGRTICCWTPGSGRAPVTDTRGQLAIPRWEGTRSI